MKPRLFTNRHFGAAWPDPKRCRPTAPVLTAYRRRFFANTALGLRGGSGAGNGSGRGGGGASLARIDRSFREAAHATPGGITPTIKGLRPDKKYG